MNTKSMTGETYHNIDGKNRLIVPKQFREQLGNPFVFTRGIDNCLYAYPVEEWEKFRAKVSVLPDATESSRRFKRFFFSGAAVVEYDKQGRALVPQNLVEYANLKDEIVTIGMDNKLEVWSKEKWMDMTYSEDSIKETSELMIEFGF